MPRVWRTVPTVWSPVLTKSLQDLIEGRRLGSIELFFYTYDVVQLVL